MAERLRCWKREEAKRKWHDKVTASARAASEKSREKQQLLAAEAKGLAKIPEDSKGKAQRQFPFLIHAAVTLSKVRASSR